MAASSKTKTKSQSTVKKATRKSFLADKLAPVFMKVAPWVIIPTAIALGTHTVIDFCFNADETMTSETIAPAFQENEEARATKAVDTPTP